MQRELIRRCLLESQETSDQTDADAHPSKYWMLSVGLLYSKRVSCCFDFLKTAQMWQTVMPRCADILLRYSLVRAANSQIQSPLEMADSKTFDFNI